MKLKAFYIMRKIKNKLWHNHTGLIDLYRLLQTSPNILIFSLFRRDNNSADKIRRYYSLLFWRNLPLYGISNCFKIFLYFFIWPYFAFRYTMKEMGLKPYRIVKTITGKSIIQQIIEQIYLAFFHSLSVKEYYMYEIYKKPNRKRIDKYLLRMTFKPLIYSFLDTAYMKANNLTEMNHQDSKSYFYSTCLNNNLPTIPIYAKESKIGFDFLIPKEEIMAKEDLFIKPEEAKGGRGGQIWRKQNNRYVNSTGHQLDFDSLLKYIKKSQSNNYKYNYIIQPRIQNHDNLNFKTNALSTVRINTLLIDNQIYIPFAVFRFSTNVASEVDNFHAGGYASAIDIASGQIGEASSMGFKNPGQWLKNHPVSNTKIKGLTLPYWEETKRLVVDAHKIGFYNRTLLGWDVAITNQGPVLVECNGWPDTELIQKPYNKPLSKFSEIELLADKIEKEYKKIYSQE